MSTINISIIFSFVLKNTIDYKNSRYSKHTIFDGFVLSENIDIIN
jgi:hypothetical protein